ncbi:hypothetical protein [Sulfolobus acidocaldarius]|uniref:Conserved conjugative plasmid protein n=4 Tax=Sulfolobus acidocaldarius TaxID=2285 RepID=Q4JBB7_SULAC|nr:hypothetical protein [Sulfolobus acidocaldarius]AAY79912.1 conserved conjugative plasmid protein [Sulfolobus acidocaldarius DSM 639]AGE70479.1 conjugative plasmid protein [Sulfolobus acidocaldarius N8]AGE72752.1 conjugative plasmid protein [Sulfolobus acidocaldarius Ron12/I]ALU29147.1 conjugal transfer protein [Sulfolobus acidocaldarius]ALU31873.1 conjugal transfer protein [Sulfolobus acidocaldarius]
MKLLNKIVSAVRKGAIKIATPVLQYRKGNHDGAMGGILAGLAMLGGSIASTFDSSFKSLLGNDASYIGDFLGILGFAALVGGIMEYRRVRSLRRS